MNTPSESCATCNKNAKVLNELAAIEYLKNLSGWMILEKASVLQLTKSYAFANFIKAKAFANKIGGLAEEENHHPAILIEWGNVTLYWWTHKLKGLTALDFEMAATSDLLFESEISGQLP